MSRVGSCCKGGSRGGPQFNDLNSIGAIKLFLELVDKGATVKDYQRKFGWSRATIALKMQKLNLYRRTYLCSQKIKKIMMDNTGTPDDVRPEVNRLRRLMWRDGPLDEV